MGSLPVYLKKSLVIFLPKVLAFACFVVTSSGLKNISHSGAVEYTFDVGANAVWSGRIHRHFRLSEYI